jgi:hypothetical protein
MTTLEKNNSLVEVLTFTPGIHTIVMHDYGGEVVMGRITSEVYDYFKQNNINVTDYALGDHQDVPTEFQPFIPGSWFECDNIAHEYGAEMEDFCFIEIRNSNGETVWSSNMAPEILEDAGCNVDCVNECTADEFPKNTIMFYGQSSEKGKFFESEIDLKTEFDPSKLSIAYSEIEDWHLFSSVSYDGVELDSDEFNTDINSDVRCTFIKVLDEGETETYDGSNNERADFKF